MRSSKVPASNSQPVQARNSQELLLRRWAGLRLRRMRVSVQMSIRLRTDDAQMDSQNLPKNQIPSEATDQRVHWWTAVVSEHRIRTMDNICKRMARRQAGGNDDGARSRTGSLPSPLSSTSSQTKHLAATLIVLARTSLTPLRAELVRSSHGRGSVGMFSSTFFALAVTWSSTVEVRITRCAPFANCTTAKSSSFVVLHGSDTDPDPPV